MINLKKMGLITAATCTLACSSAFAGSFQLWNQTGRSVGNAGAGEAAVADDATTAWYNAAGLTQLKNQEVSISGIGFYQYTKFDGTIAATTQGFTKNSTGTSTYHKFSPMPTLQYAAPISDKWAFGLALDSPFGASVGFSEDAPVRYAVIENNITTYDIAPSVAYQVTPKISLGAGPDIVYAKASLKSAEYNPLGADLISENEASTWKVGYHLSALWNITPATRVGFNYRSKLAIHATGTSKLTGYPDEDVKARAVLPPVWTLSAFHQLNPTWDLLGTVNYIQWGQFDNLTLENIAPSGSTIVRPENYINSWLLSAGANYHFSPKWVFRGALGFDESPTKEAYRNPTAPDNDRIVLSVGAGYHITDNVSLDAGYTHFFISKSKTTAYKPDPSETWQADGNLNQYIDIVGLQLNWKFT
jgi:long-chain fatty acid transport protein